MSNVNRGGWSNPPSLFDFGLFIFALGTVFFLKPWDLNMAQGWFFVFGVFALLGLSFFIKQKRPYHNKLLGSVVLWSLANIFIHTLDPGLAQTYATAFINFALLSEGFIYILCGAILFGLVVSYSKRFSLFYPLLIINILNLCFAIIQKLGLDFIWLHNGTVFGLMGTQSQLSVISAVSIPVLANVGLGLAIFPIANLILARSFTGALALLIVGMFGIKKMRNKALLLVLTSIVVVTNFHSLFQKAVVRLEAWGIAIREIFKSPLIGLGFDNTLNMNMVRTKSGGFVYRHNDFLNISRDLGLIFTIILCYGIWLILKNTKKDYLWYSILILLVSCFFQTNAYFPRIAITGIIMLALKERENVGL